MKTTKTKSVPIDASKDPTLPFTEITIKGKPYRMCLDLGALAEAEHEIVRQGHDVNLLVNLPPVNLETMRIVFAASLRKFHPEIAYADALQLLTLPFLQDAYAAVIDAWNKALAEPSGEAGGKNPTEPGSETQS